ncbi:MAG: helical backbone metal receptor [Methylophaga sp.]|nr:helical backbone metal receptor [Methylophaga sp.]
MRRFWPLLPLLMIWLFALWQTPTDKDAPESAAVAKRIISLAPSITETVFAVGAGAQLVAVTDFCQYPRAAQDLPRIGGYLDPSLSQIVSQQPDLVIMLDRQQSLNKQLRQLGINTLLIDNARLAGIMDSILRIGAASGHPQKAQQLHDQLQQQITTVKQQIADKPRKNTLLAIAHYTNSEQLDLVYIAGQQDFYNDILRLAGGRNVYQDKRLKVPAVSMEGLLRMNPEVIIDIFPDASAHNADLLKVRQQWQQLTPITAVKQQQIHFIEAGYATVPGPRIIQLLIDIAQLLHPEIKLPANAS